VSALISDVRTAIRALTAARGFTAIAVFSLGIGTALAVTILSVVNAYILRGMPYPAANRLVRIDYASANQPPPRGMEQLEWTSLDDVIEFPIAWDLDVFYLLGREYPESTPGAWVTPGYMGGFGIRVAKGRTFTVADFQAGSPAVAIISHRVWQTRFGGDAQIVGRMFQSYVSDRPEEPESFTIVGVLPPDWWHFNAYSEVLAPLKAPTYPYMARLRPGVTAIVAAERIDALVRAGIPSVTSSFKVAVTSAHDSYIGPIRPVLWSIATAAGLVLLIAAANVAVLMLVRARRRDKELAIRLALGASHRRVARLLVLEGLLLGVASTAIGVALSAAATASLAPLVEGFLDRRIPGGLRGLHIDATVLAGACFCGAMVTLVFTLIPFATLSRTSVLSGLSSSARGSTIAKSGRSRAILIGVEVAASLALLTGAALMAESAMRMLRVDFGVRADDVVTASLALRQRSFPDDASRVAYFDQLMTQLAGVAGGEAVALGDWWPLQGSRPRRVHTGGADPVVGSANPFGVTAGYFETLGMSVRDGRTFTAQDRLGSEPVAIISQSLAHRLWPASRAIGEPLTVEMEAAGPLLTLRVVGVVNDVRQSHNDTDLFDLYVPLVQRPGRFAFLYVRGPSSPTWESDIQAAVARINPEVAVGAPRRLSLGLEQERARPRFLAFLLTTFAIVACVLVLIGMHGVIAYTVRQRQREVAVRIAVGASAGIVTRMFLRQGVTLLTAGLAAGVLAAIALGRVLQSQLYGVRASEPRVLALAVLALGACALTAILWPAWRAASIDPVAILKEE
jgi:putative ABC transport system permease protein